MWPFRKKPAPVAIIDRRENGLGWKPGDLAECIVDGWNDPTPHAPKLGDILRVARIGDSVNHRNIRCIWLYFEGGNNCGYNTQGFRKIVVSHDANEIEEGIIAKIKRAAKQGADA